MLLGEGADGVGRVFEDIEALARTCRFADCGTDAEPGCAVREAVNSGELDVGRFASYRKLQREARYHAGKVDVRVRIEENRKWRKIHLEARRRPDKRRPLR